jgi:hypothetical protein
MYSTTCGLSADHVVTTEAGGSYAKLGLRLRSRSSHGKTVEGSKSPSVQAWLFRRQAPSRPDLLQQCAASVNTGDLAATA